jgi:solute carrier family 45 protein 1/2/4
MVTLIFAKETPLTREVDPGNPLVDSFKAVCHMPKPVWRAGIVLFLALMSYTPFQAACTDYFGHDVFRGANPSDEYDDGVAFGCLVVAVSFFVVAIISFFADKIVERIGMKWTFFLAEFCDFFAFTSVLYVRNRWGLMMTLSPSGIPFGVAISIPYTITGLCVPEDQIGVYIGALNIVIEVSGQLGLYLFQSGIGSLFVDRGPTIASAGFSAVFAMIACFFIISPEEFEKDESMGGVRENLIV